jgi:hypothetical protein
MNVFPRDAYSNAMDRDRMVKSAENFAVGFFGYPLDGQYQQSIMIQAPGVCTIISIPLHVLIVGQFNNTLSPSDT